MATGLTNPTNSAALAVSGLSATWTGIPAGTNVPAYADARIGAGGKHVFQVTPSMGSADTVSIAFVGNTRLYNDGLPIYTGAFGLWMNPAANQTRLYDGQYNVITDIGPYSAGDSFTFAIDFTNKTYWCRRNGGNWNGSGTADPATNTGGISFASYLGTDVYVVPVVAFGSNAGGGNASVSCNFGATAISGLTAPSGFYGTDWSRLVITAAGQNAPAGWSDMNWIEAIGAGSNGGAGTGTGTPANGLGGGGGAFAAKWGITGITPGAAFTYQLGASNGSATGTGATTVGAGPTLRAAGAGATTKAGGTTANSIGDLLFAGGAGVAAGASGGAAGGAAGRGKMLAGTSWLAIGTGGSGSGSTGGSGNNGTTAGGTTGANGITSTVEYDTAGSGSGAPNRGTAGVGYNGGSYGAGGGGGRRSGNAGGNGAPGLLVLFWYSPVPGPNYVYRGASTWAAKYKGVRTDAQIYKGTRILHP